MCGIAGVLDYSNSTKLDTIEKMLKIIQHRGPDEGGTFAQGPILLGHRRLSILDLKQGRQPMTSECGQVTITFNGEIYNYIELRKELRTRGFSFRTNSDTEVILNLYKDKGIEFTHKLNGQWAIAIWDNRLKKLILSRDRFGIRPLHYYRTPQLFAFASEAKALFCHPKISPSLSPTSIIDTLTFWNPTTGKTVFTDIHEVLPGETTEVFQDRVSTHRHWKFDFTSESNMDFRDAADSVKKSLISATKLRLRSDVPVASYLSGGLDSYIISHIASQEQKLTTFSISFPNTSVDESEFQKLAAKHLCSNHHTLYFDAEKFGKFFRKSIWHIEKPILRSGPIPLVALSEFVSQNGFKVVLTGEGADELFCGYDIFREMKARIFQANHPKFFTNQLFEKKVYGYKKIERRFDQKLKSHFFSSLDFSSQISSHIGRWQNGRLYRNILSDELIESTFNYSPIESQIDSLGTHDFDWLKSAQFLEANLLLPGYILSSQSDRVGLANGVEARFPFLDHNVAHLANRLPNHFKLSRMNEKHILKEVFKDAVPERILNRPKRPYESPINEYITRNHQSCGHINDLLSQEKLKKFNIFSPKRVSMLRKKIDSSKNVSHRDSTLLLAILSTQQLAELFTYGNYE